MQSPPHPVSSNTKCFYWYHCDWYYFPPNVSIAFKAEDYLCLHSCHFYFEWTEIKMFDDEKFLKIWNIFPISRIWCIVWWREFATNSFTIKRYTKKLMWCCAINFNNHGQFFQLNVTWIWGHRVKTQPCFSSRFTSQFTFHWYWWVHIDLLLPPPDIIVDLLLSFF